MTIFLEIYLSGPNEQPGVNAVQYATHNGCNREDSLEGGSNGVSWLAFQQNWGQKHSLTSPEWEIKKKQSRKGFFFFFLFLFCHVSLCIFASVSCLTQIASLHSSLPAALSFLPFPVKAFDTLSQCWIQVELEALLFPQQHT